MLSGDAPVLISSLAAQPPGRRGRVPRAGPEPGVDRATPARPALRGAGAAAAELTSRRGRPDDRSATSAPTRGMTSPSAADHMLDAPADPDAGRPLDEPDLTKMVFRIDAPAGQHVRLDKIVAYHTSRGLPVRELADRCQRTLDRAARYDFDALARRAASLVRPLLGAAATSRSRRRPAHDAASRRSGGTCSSLAQASGPGRPAGRARQGRDRLGLRGPLLLGQRDLRRAVPRPTRAPSCRAEPAALPQPACCRAARERARELSQRGALFPWRTINGEEASAYYAAGTAQFHIDADIAHALAQYVERHRRRRVPRARRRRRSSSRPPGCGTTSASGADNGERSFHIHGVTGPDEYTTVVNDNLFTNVMARYNLGTRRRRSSGPAREEPEALRRAGARGSGSSPTRGRASGSGRREAMHIPFDERPRHPPAGRLLPRPRGLGPRDARRRSSAPAAALPPAGDLPLPGAQAGRRRARAVPARRPVHRRAEAARTSTTTTRSPPATRRCRRRAVHRRGRGGLRGARARVLPLRAAHGPRRRRRQRLRRRARRLHRRRVAGARLRLRRDARLRRRAFDPPAPAVHLALAGVLASLPGARHARRATHGLERYLLEDGEPLDVTIDGERRRLEPAGRSSCAPKWPAPDPPTVRV